MMNSEIKEKVNQVLADEFELDLDKLIPEATLYEDLGMDSLDAVDMVVAFEKQFEIKIGKDPVIVKIKTLGELQDYVIEKVKK